MTDNRTPWKSAFVSHRGAVRQVNEDAFLEAPDLNLWAVADGMGGHAGGQLASRMVIDALDSLPAETSDSRLLRQVESRLHSVNRHLRDLSESQFSGRIIGCTVAVLMRSAAKVVGLWAGDSRIYLFRSGRLFQLTRDHSRSEEMIAQGLLLPGQADDPRNANIVTRAVGAEDALDLDRFDQEIGDDDLFLLCTDGLNKVFGNGEIEAALLRGNDCAAIVGGLLDQCLAKNPTDNVTIGVVQVVSDDLTDIPPVA